MPNGVAYRRINLSNTILLDRRLDIIFTYVHYTYIVYWIEDLKVVRGKGLRHADERRLRGAGDAVRVGETLVGAVEGLGNLPFGRLLHTACNWRVQKIFLR